MTAMLSQAARLILAAVLALPAWSAALALDPAKAPTQYSHENWQSSKGLPQNAVSAIVQDHQGYIWCATQEGLVRFDGVQFTVFDKWNTPAITRHNIRALCLDRTGALWIGTNGGGLVRMRDGEFTAFTTREGLVYDNVTSLCEGRDGSIWVGTYGGGLSRYRGGRFTNYTTASGLPHDSILALCTDEAGALWIGTNGGGLCRFMDERFTVFGHGQGLPNPVIYALCSSRGGALWVGTYGGGLCRFDGKSFRTFTTRDGLSNDRILGLHEDKDGNLWIGTFGGGVSRYYGGRWATFSTAQGLAYDVVRCFCEDREGNLWIGIDGGGLSRLHDGSFTTFSTQEGLSNDYAIGIYQTREGDVWITTNGGGINRFREGRLTSFSTRDGLPNDLVRSIFEDAQGALWVATDGGGLARVMKGRVTTFNTSNGLTSNRVIAVRGDRRGNIWVGTNGGGLNRIRGGKVTAVGQGLGTSGLVNLIHEDREGRLWIGSYGGGLSLFQGEKLLGFEGRDAIGPAIVNYIHEDGDGTFWLGTIGSGILRLRGGKVARFTRRDGLFDDVAYEILDDGLGYFWMSGNKGVYRVARKDLEAFADGRIQAIPCTSYGEPDGMKSAECNGGFVPAGFRTADGHLWFPTMRGVATVDPARLSTNTLVPPVLVERLVLNRGPLALGHSVALPPGRNSLEIHYTGLSFVAPSRVKFRYRLEGFDENWVDAGTRRVAYYTNIPPGRYRFQVVACNNDGVWNTEGASLALVQRPRFYQTLWFLGALACLLGLAGPGLYLLRVRSLQDRQRELETLVRDRTQLLSETNLRLEQANVDLARLSSQDGLTGVANRRSFDFHLESAWRTLARSREPLSLIMADLDSFKAYNDAYGHQEGDECLRRVAKTLASASRRAGDQVARYGGEEFAIVLSATDSAGAARVAEALRAAVEDLAIPHRCSPASGVVTVSLGVATAAPADSSSPAHLIAAADRALYRAKQEGRNRLVVASSSALPA